jgi:competence protein ComEC
MSISGLHATMFAWLAGLLVAAAWRRSADGREPGSCERDTARRYWHHRLDGDSR